MKEKTKDLLQKIKSYLFAFICWLILGSVLGSLCGVIGYAFAEAIEFGTGMRQEHGWLLYLLPVAGMLSVLIYKLLRVSDIGTNRVLESARSKNKVPILLGPAVFAGTVLSHTFGASAGREGAALQLGGSISSLFCKTLKLDEKSKHILTMCGMAALFSALFGTPLGAAVFAIEVISVGYICSAAIFPCLISSVSAYLVAHSLGAHAERFTITSIPQLNLNTLWKVALIGVAGALVSMLFCKALHLSEHLAKKYLKNEFLRILAGGSLLVLLPIILRTTDYNGGGINIINNIFEKGEVKYEAFLLKILFTAITVAAGYKGGEIVPTMFIGATLGGSLAHLLGLNPGFGAAVEIAALFCGVTNCPLGTLVLCVELFTGEGILFFAISSSISFILSGKASLYSKQNFIFSKLNDETLETSE
ncbi:MAG: chloride channel protein [Ruminococcaceae bacterium]|nr:chloride channel protein [Oscillospiraceae bacterium]